ncbi:uracil-DNA glycosylase [Kordiimonas pumila]|uniref:Type-4 uracil-DNA glycosylase n=1 Tax=Kordiimonas pumila TaxID=2161677 RepID=A0ABV7D846_9PROT|nr:uracil-DNA glycosylase [Kordiimonas pumila]
MNQGMAENHDPKALLEWYIAMGVDEVIADTPVDRFTEPKNQNTPSAITQPASASHAARPVTRTPLPDAAQIPTPIAARPTQPTSGAGAEAALKVATACTSIAELKEALEAFDGGLLKRSAKNTVFADGAPDSPLMVIGDTPGSEEDISGTPFVGPAGILLDKMLAAIDMGRGRGAYLTNLCPWRPLGNAVPDAKTIEMLLPFTKRHIELAAPKVIMLLGGLPMKALFDTSDGISRQRGKWKELTIADHNFAAIATYHPDFLLSQPLQKAAAWHDLLLIKEKLTQL